MRSRLLLVLAVAPLLGLLGGPPAAAGGGEHAAAGGVRACAEPEPDQPVSVTRAVMRHFCFDPGVVSLAPGDSLEIANEDPVLHNLYGPVWQAGEVAPGDSVSRTFDEPGTYTFGCTLHPGMTGAVVVGELEPITTSSALAGDGGGGGAPVALLVGIAVALGVGLAAGLLVSGSLRRSPRDTEPHGAPAHP